MPSRSDGLDVALGRDTLSAETWRGACIHADEDYFGIYLGITQVKPPSSEDLHLRHLWVEKATLMHNRQEVMHHSFTILAIVQQRPFDPTLFIRLRGRFSEDEVHHDRRDS